MRVRLLLDNVVVGYAVRMEGDVVDVPEDVARRFFHRGHAAPHVEAPAPAPPGPEAPADGPPAADPRPRKRPGKVSPPAPSGA